MANSWPILLLSELRLTPKLQHLILQTVMKSFKLLSVILAGFWVAACVTTSSSRKTTPPSTTPQQTQTESSQTQQAPEQSPSDQPSAQGTSQSKQTPSSGQSQASQSASQETSKDHQQQASKSSQSGQTTSQETGKDQQQQGSEKSQSGQAATEQAAKDQPQQASEKSPSGQTDSQGSAGDDQKQIAKKTDSGQTAAGATKRPDAGAAREASAGSADAKLEEARQNLRISEATEKRIASELEALKRSGTASPETIENYETYHESVKEMVAENRRIVEQMEAARARHASAVSSAEGDGGKPGDMLDPQIPEEQATDRVAALDRELNASLNQFDARLLKEMDDIREESADKMRDLAQEAAEAARRLRESGVAVDTTGSESSQSSEETAAKGQTGKESEQGADGAKTASTESSRPGGKGGGGAQEEQARYEDDDIVARQLREAAENETDPELKEKLWKEYYEYKKNQGP